MSPNTIVLAKLVGPIMVFAGLGIAINKKLIKELLEDFIKSTGLMFLAGMFAAVIGMLMVTSHTLWNSVPAVILTVLGWMSVLKGALLMISPQHMIQLTKKMKKMTDAYVVIGIIYVGLGLYLGYVGFFM